MLAVVLYRIVANEPVPAVFGPIEAYPKIQSGKLEDDMTMSNPPFSDPGLQAESDLATDGVRRLEVAICGSSIVNSCSKEPTHYQTNSETIANDPLRHALA